MQENNTLLNSDLYKPNSNKSKRENAKKKEVVAELPPKNVQKVVNGEISSKEQSIIKQAALGFLADREENIKQYIILDVLIPTMKDTFMNVLSMLVYGDVRGARSGGYDSMYKKKKNGTNVVQSPYRKPNRRAVHDFRDVRFKQYRDAMDVLSQLNELIEVYQSASVADFYASLWDEDDEELKKVSKWTDREWGWTSLEGVVPERAIGGGWYLPLPRPERFE